MARPGQRAALKIWSWVSASDQTRSKYRSKRGQKPQTRREHMLAIELGKLAKQMRIQAQLGSYEASERLCISQPQLSYYENGKDAFRVSTLCEMAELYERDISEFFNVIANINES